MALPALLPAILGFARSAGVQQAVAGVFSGDPSGGMKKRRRRRKRLSASDKEAILFLKTAVGKTAAANYVSLLGKG